MSGARAFQSCDACGWSPLAHLPAWYEPSCRVAGAANEWTLHRSRLARLAGRAVLAMIRPAHVGLFTRYHANEHRPLAV